MHNIYILPICCIFGHNATRRIDKLKFYIIDIIKAGPGVVTTAEIASEMEISWNTAEKYLLELALENQVLRIKKAGVNLWVLKKK